MDKRTYLQVVCLFWCCLLASSSGEGMNTEKASLISTENRRNSVSEDPYTEQESTTSLQRYSSCVDCYKQRTKFPKSIAEKIHSSEAISPFSYDNMDGSITAVPKESEKVIFSRKYSPRLEDNGFVPVSGPYGSKNSLARGNSLRIPTSNAYKSRSESRYANSASKRERNPTPRHAQNKHPQSVQRRSQYRGPKIHDELSMKESIASGNILGNGNFEIIRGGIYSDQDANEILGSRRIGRGFGSYVVPTYHQNRFRSTQTVQFPPHYQRRVQNPVHPIFYPRAPY